MPKKTARQTKPSARATASDPMAEVESRAADSYNSKILFLENPIVSWEVLAEYLGIHGYEVVSCKNPVEATTLIKRFHFDLILTDLRLRDGEDEFDVSGLEFLKKIRKQSINIPAIIYASFPTYELVREAMTMATADTQPLADFVLSWIEGLEELLKHIKLAIEKHRKLALGNNPLNEAKLIFVGRGSVGKTSLINRLVWNRFDGSEKKTEGIHITEWPLVINRAEKVRLNVWDFGGQEIMHATHQFFLTERSLYVLVLSGRSGLEESDAEYWLKLIESFGGDSPVVLVLNKIKEHSFDVNRRALWQKYPFVVRDSFLRTDCMDATGIDALCRIIEREADKLEHLRDPFPTSWFRIKDELATLQKNYLRFDEFCAVCAKYGEAEEESQDALAYYLHHLGIALNFKDDPRLQDTHVLKPQWVTEGIYTILNAPRLAERKGELRLRDLKDILPAKHYPANMHGFVLDLMKKFELCFTFPDSDTHYLIPELLDKQEPAAAGEFEAAQCLNFRYEYDVLPEGLLPRFIVRTHGLIEDEHRWRTGVILRFEEGRALVKADLADKRVFIHVTGKAEARRRLLAVIRSDFERIHHDLRFKPAELVPLFDHPDEAVTYEELKVYEQSGMPTFTKVVSGKVIQVDVQEHLNGVDLAGTRRKEDKQEAMLEMREEPIRVFISYAHKDERFRLQLEPHLKLLQRKGQIVTWHDRLIKPGSQWADAIDANLEQAKIILLLVSADFIASDYCYEKEMTRALERHAAKEAVVIPVIIRDCQWTSAPFAKLQGLPKDGKAVDLWTKRDTAWRNVANGIEKVAQKLRQRRSSNE